jgi:hypothetical protein
LKYTVNQKQEEEGIPLRVPIRKIAKRSVKKRKGKRKIGKRTGRCRQLK